MRKTRTTLQIQTKTEVLGGPESSAEEPSLSALPNSGRDRKGLQPPGRLGERPPLRDHPRVHVLACEPAHRNDTPVPVAVLAGNRPPCETFAKRTGGSCAAPPSLTSRTTGRFRLGGINTIEPDRLPANLERVSVGDGSHPGNLSVHRKQGECGTRRTTRQGIPNCSSGRRGGNT